MAAEDRLTAAGFTGSIGGLVYDEDYAAREHEHSERIRGKARADMDRFFRGYSAADRRIVDDWYHGTGPCTLTPLENKRAKELLDAYHRHVFAVNMRDLHGPPSASPGRGFDLRPVVRARGARNFGRPRRPKSGHRRVTSTRAGPDSDDGPSEPPGLRLRRHPRFGRITDALAALLDAEGAVE